MTVSGGRVRPRFLPFKECFSFTVLQQCGVMLGNLEDAKKNHAAKLKRLRTRQRWPGGGAEVPHRQERLMFHCCQISLLRKGVNTPQTRALWRPRSDLQPLVSEGVFTGNPTCGVFACLFLSSISDRCSLPLVVNIGVDLTRWPCSPCFHLLWSPCTPLPLTSVSALLLQVPSSHTNTRLHLQLP